MPGRPTCKVLSYLLLRSYHVDVGADLQTRLFADEGDDGEDDRQPDNDARDDGVLGEQDDNRANHQDAQIGAHGGVAVAAQRDVQIILQPLGERDVPPFPEVARRVGLVRRVEVLGQVEAHQHGHTDGNVGVTREVGIHLQRVDEQCGEVLKSGEQRGVVENAVHEVDGEVVAHNQFLGQTVQDPEHGDAELPSAQEEFLVELRHKLVGTHDGTRHQLREEGDIETEVQHVGDMPYLALIYIHQVTDILEGIEGDAHGQQYLGGVEIVLAAQIVGPLRQPVDDLVLAAYDGVVRVGEEVGVFEIAEYQQVDDLRPQGH